MKKLISIVSRRSALLMSLVCMLAFVSSPVFAGAPESSVNRISYQGETHQGMCCKSWDASVSINEPERQVPIVVTWSTDYRATGPSFVGLRLNDGPCVFYGPAFLPTYAPDDISYSSKTFQWVIMPGDYKLVRGKNTLTLCGGAIFSQNDSVELGFNTMRAELQK